MEESGKWRESNALLINGLLVSESAEKWLIFLLVFNPVTVREAEM